MNGATRQLPGRADHAAVRRANLAVAVRALRAGGRSRAQLAADTSLTKATVSSLVTELAGRGLVHTARPGTTAADAASNGDTARSGAVGRPGQPVELATGRVLAIGVELNVDYLCGVVLDLGGRERVLTRTAFDVPAGVDATADEVVRLVTELADRTLAGTAFATADDPAVLAGVGVAAPGLVDGTRGTVRVAPNLRWRDVPLHDLLADRLAGSALPWLPGGSRPWDERLLVDNEATLATLAEFAGDAGPDDRDLVLVTGGVGVGGGLVVDGRLVRGSGGFAGEVGHLAVAPDGARCGCGRRGCWETLCGLGALLDLAAPPDDPVHRHDEDLDVRLDLLLERARDGDERTLAAFDRVGRALGHGASMLVNLTNPRVLVLGGYFARLGEFLRPVAQAELAARVVAPDAGGVRVTLSRLGLAAAATGAAHAVLAPVLDDPTLVPTLAAQSPATTQSPTSAVHASPTLVEEIG
ncbi:Sugar kinase of the NBD/HSP70 family, may contain an N-terminal HTH domain [Actinopolymorpha cephalotaxi]|uniref:NBD/HSP70 family sugar kinase n=1 Tax=Actinopolymorpha cephalotaxi TaxID=504797 RepID=A0A1I2RZS4_9ACTN|nr:ROK family protein [Actinopolymorpha cephalotaxi]NYH83850.1 putative NBD/HSP70 family sugar kinase [Actinopolymorpha cephalotaxi]SFG46062.1 Sugar kinase of the NBD/HSP70 family, may contain an N-terminal HTH domain [Actinopolymorpha cephalotaxi]